MNHQDLARKINNEELIKLILDQQWHLNCEIISNYMPPYPDKDTKPTVVVRYKNSFLRYSAGPKQGFFWDCYGADMLTVELAIIALSQAPIPYWDKE